VRKAVVEEKAPVSVSEADSLHAVTSSV